ncbi:hypothetical protein EJC47_00740 [Sphingomonas sp. TF3]|uniref:hypothetical protein n=1 Tax=Sphingomonas sp. TF3 TaxID=2495580 RepID=UPI000F8816A6|nr:hypothetical protein [Sphingomonas sp. TF3]RUN78436.1 hypothetical protein EJC47_00740 [Sphingomonas sp. TF3]
MSLLGSWRALRDAFRPITLGNLVIIAEVLAARWHVEPAVSHRTIIVGNALAVERQLRKELGEFLKFRRRERCHGIERERIDEERVATQFAKVPGSATVARYVRKVDRELIVLPIIDWPPDDAQALEAIDLRLWSIDIDAVPHFVTRCEHGFLLSLYVSCAAANRVDDVTGAKAA